MSTSTRGANDFLARRNMSKLYYVIPTILLQGRGKKLKDGVAIISSHLFVTLNGCLPHQILFDSLLGERQTSEAIFKI